VQPPQRLSAHVSPSTTIANTTTIALAAMPLETSGLWRKQPEGDISANVAFHSVSEEKNKRACFLLFSRLSVTL